MITIAIVTLLALLGSSLCYGVLLVKDIRSYTARTNATREQKKEWALEFILPVSVISGIAFIVTLIVVLLTSVLLWSSRGFYVENSMVEALNNELFTLPNQPFLLNITKDKDGNLTYEFNEIDKEKGNHTLLIAAKGNEKFYYHDLAADAKPYVTMSQQRSCYTRVEYQNRWLFSRDKADEDQCYDSVDPSKSSYYREWNLYLPQGAINRNYSGDFSENAKQTTTQN